MQLRDHDQTDHRADRERQPGLPPVPTSGRVWPRACLGMVDCGRLRCDAEGVDRGRNVLDLLRAQILELDRQLVGDLLVDGARRADPARDREAAQSGRDIHAVAQQVAFPFHDVRDRDPDPIEHLAVGRKREIARPDAFLHIERATHRVDRARELRQRGIARRVEDASAPARHEVVEDPAVQAETAQRLLLVFRDEPAVTRDIGGQDG
jgi:hypothetical protein